MVNQVHASKPSKIIGYEREIQEITSAIEQLRLRGPFPRCNHFPPEGRSHNDYF